jgi:nicotinamidase-related amidase
MTDDDQLRYGPLDERCIHLCVDMQNLFARKTDWHTPWMERVTPVVRRIAERYPTRTIFTRFVPLARPGEGKGTWKRYYERWANMTTERLAPDMIELVPGLADLVPPAEVVDKHVYSPWATTDLDQRLRDRGVDSLIITGGETDVCVLATVMGAIDRGYRVVLPKDALCSSSDETHDASVTLYYDRFGLQVEATTADVVLQSWC